MNRTFTGNVDFEMELELPQHAVEEKRESARRLPIASQCSNGCSLGSLLRPGPSGDSLAFCLKNQKHKSVIARPGKRRIAVNPTVTRKFRTKAFLMR